MPLLWAQAPSPLVQVSLTAPRLVPWLPVHLPTHSPGQSNLNKVGQSGPGVPSPRSKPLKVSPARATCELAAGYLGVFWLSQDAGVSSSGLPFLLGGSKLPPTQEDQHLPGESGRPCSLEPRTSPPQCPASGTGVLPERSLDSLLLFPGKKRTGWLPADSGPLGDVLIGSVHHPLRPARCPGGLLGAGSHCDPH